MVTSLTPHCPRCGLHASTAAVLSEPQGADPLPRETLRCPCGEVYGVQWRSIAVCDVALAADAEMVREAARDAFRQQNPALASVLERQAQRVRGLAFRRGGARTQRGAVAR